MQHRTQASLFLNRTDFHIWHDSQQKGGFDFDVATLFETRSCTDMLLHSLLVDIVLAHIVSHNLINEGIRL